MDWDWDWWTRVREWNEDEWGYDMSERKRETETRSDKRRDIIDREEREKVEVDC